jgi:hypothetical protein
LPNLVGALPDQETDLAEYRLGAGWVIVALQRS